MRIRKALIRASLSTAILAALLLVPAGLIAGQWIWPSGLVAVGVVGGATLVANVTLAIWRPASFDVRNQALGVGRKKRQPWIDAVGLIVYLGVLLGWTILLPIDVFRLHLAPVPTPGVSAAGLAAMVLGQAISYAAVWQNAFAAPTVHDQSGEGQVIIDTGIYGLIRHPLYAGNLVTFSGLALWLGSYAALAGVAVMLAFTIARIVVIEEPELRRTLPGYEDYARRVRARLVPFVA